MSQPNARKRSREHDISSKFGEMGPTQPQKLALELRVSKDYRRKKTKAHILNQCEAL